MTIRLLRTRMSGPQVAFVNSESSFPALVAGFGAGKTQACIMRALRLKFDYPDCDIAYYLPTYDLVRMIGYPRFSELLQNARISFKLNKSDHVLSIGGRGNIIFRTLDNPERIVGYEVGHSLVDELDTLKRDDAQRAWNQIIARNRQKLEDGGVNTVGVGTTPEGFRFVYERWRKTPAPGYELIKASTYSNARNLPSEYIPNLKASYPPQLISAYLDGEFVNLNAGAVYPDFSREENHADIVEQPGEPIWVGQDFNVYNCTSVIGVTRDNAPVVVNEISGVRDTPDVARLLKERYPNRQITIYPDASGKSNKTVNASASDIQILKDAGFTVKANPSNPLVKDRVMSLNGQIKNGDGKRRLKVNTKRAPLLTECLEQQTYDKNGEPDKSAGKDHANDALGYPIAFMWPIVKPPSTSVTPLRL